MAFLIKHKSLDSLIILRALNTSAISSLKRICYYELCKKNSNSLVHFISKNAVLEESRRIFLQIESAKTKNTLNEKVRRKSAAAGTKVSLCVLSFV